MIDGWMKPAMILMAIYAVGIASYMLWDAPIELQFALAVFTIGFGPFWLIGFSFYRDYKIRRQDGKWRH